MILLISGCCSALNFIYSAITERECGRCICTGNNGEPGTIQSMLVRGLSSPVFSNKDVSGVQPTIYLNGVPLMLETAMCTISNSLILIR